MFVAHHLLEFCRLASVELENFSGRRDICIFSTGVVCDVLNSFGVKAIPLRVTALVFPGIDDVRPGCELGREGYNEPGSATDKWFGHLVTLVNDLFLVDTTLTQVNDIHPHLAVTPCVIFLPETWWPKTSPNCTGNLAVFPSKSVVRYTKFRTQAGWEGAPDYNQKARKRAVKRLRELVERCP